MNILEDAAVWLTDQLKYNLSQTVILKRGTTAATTGVAATKCSTTAQADTEYGILQVTGSDWIIKASAYVIGGSVVEPQKNDLITDANGDIWQVLAPFAGEQEYRPLDPQATAWRIHTKRTEV